MTRRKTIKVFVWTCNREDHRHRSKDAALSCERRIKHARAVRRTVKWTEKKKADLQRRREAGEPWGSIAKRFGVSVRRAQEVLRSIQIRAELDDYWRTLPVEDRPIYTLSLSKHAAELLREECISTVGDLLLFSAKDLLKIPTFKTHLREVEDALKKFGLSLQKQAEKPQDKADSTGYNVE